MKSLDITEAHIEYGEENGRVFLSWDPRVLHWVMIDEPDAHRDHLAGRRETQIVRCPYDHTGNFQIVERPSFKEAMTFWQVSDAIHEWIVDMGFRYAIDRRWDGSEFGWKVGFLTRQEAMAFKLAWWKP